VAVLAHRGELELSEEQANLLEQADAELQVRLTRLRAEGGVPAQAAGGLSGSLHGGPQPSDPRAGGYGSPGGAPVTGLPGAGAPSGGRPGGFGMNMGPGGFQASPTGGGMPGGSGQGGAGPAAGAPAGAARRDPVKAQEALDAGLDDADTRAFLKAEAALTPAQRERARDIASRYREQLFERREQQRGR
jgi:hypothetical protein